MKTRALFIAVAFLAAAVLESPALEKKPKDQVKPAKTSKKSKDTKSNQGIEYTGSYIKQNLRQNGNITDGANQLYVIDSTMIRNSGASDVRDLLNRRGLAH